MKKLLALLLSMILAMSLAVPAFAAEAEEPAPEDAIPISAFLPEATNDSALGIIGGADGPTAIITAPIPGLEGLDLDNIDWNELTWKLIDSQKEALGGVAGQIGVMVNGEYIQFPDAAPEARNGRTMVPVRALVEALGGEVEYNDGAVRLVIDGCAYEFAIGRTTVTVNPAADNDKDTPKLDDIKMDCAPYVSGGRTYVPIRFISEALGYEVGWDGAYQTAILLDRDALAAEIDEEFTILNKVQANRGAAIGEGESRLTDAKCSLTATLFDTINGSKTYTADLTGKTLMNAEAISGTCTFTLSDNAVDALTGLMIGNGAAEEDAELLRTVIAGLKDMEVIMTADGMVWAHAPILDEMAGEENVWAAMDMGAELGQLLALQMNADSLTIGSVIASAVSADSVSGWIGMTQMMDMMYKIYGDDQFSTVGGVSTLTFGKDELMALYEDMGIDTDEVKNAFKEYRITMKVDAKGGADVSCVMETNSQDFVPAVKITAKATQSAGKADMTMMLHVANICEIKLTASSAEKASSDAPKTEPPEDAFNIDLGASVPAPLPEYEGSGVAE